MSRTIELTEYQRHSLPREALSDEAGLRLRRDYGRYVAVEYPTPFNQNRWQLTAQGWVGHIPLGPDVRLVLRPKIPVANLFRMLEYAYQVPLRTLPGLVQTETLPDFFERLAAELARRVLDRTRRGLHRAYLDRREALPYLRGRLDVAANLRRPAEQVRLACHYEEHTADIEDNRLLVWTLDRLARSPLQGETTRQAVRRAGHALRGAVTVRPYPAAACRGRAYHRLNEDYAPMHALCYFFLAHLGPEHHAGDRPMLPFLVNTAQLYEKFVAEWLRAKLPDAYELHQQERVDFGQDQRLHFSIDLVLRERATGAVRWVLDTKYKAASRVQTDDIHQVVNYAYSLGSPQAGLIYPTAISPPLDERHRQIRLRTLTFALDGDLEAAGQNFLHSIGLD